MDTKEIRLKYGLSQQELADRTGIPKDRIGKWEQGKGKPKIDDSKKLEDFLAKEKVPHEQPVDEAAHSDDKESIRSLSQALKNLSEDKIRTTALIERMFAYIERSSSWGDKEKDSQAQGATGKSEASQAGQQHLGLGRRYTKNKQH